MSRRNYLSMLTTGIVPFLNDEWRETIWNTTDPPATTENPALQDFLVPESTLHDAYTPVKPDELVLTQTVETTESGAYHTTSTTQSNWDSQDQRPLGYHLAIKEYVIPTDSQATLADSESTLTTKALKPITTENVDTTPADLHRYLYNDWWGSDVGSVEEYATDCVEVRSNERADPHRWTEYFIRQPVLYLDPELAEAAPTDQPYFEQTLIIATTDWGVISLRGDTLQLGQKGTSFEAVRELASELHQQARSAPTPIVRETD